MRLAYETELARLREQVSEELTAKAALDGRVRRLDEELAVAQKVCCCAAVRISRLRLSPNGRLSRQAVTDGNQSLAAEVASIKQQLEEAHKARASAQDDVARLRDELAAVCALCPSRPARPSPC
jgi:hypothetical protein